MYKGFITELQVFTLNVSKQPGTTNRYLSNVSSMKKRNCVKESEEIETVQEVEENKTVEREEKKKLYHPDSGIREYSLCMK